MLGIVVAQNYTWLMLKVPTNLEPNSIQRLQHLQGLEAMHAEQKNEKQQKIHPLGFEPRTNA